MNDKNKKRSDYNYSTIDLQISYYLESEGLWDIPIARNGTVNIALKYGVPILRLLQLAIFCLMTDAQASFVPSVSPTKIPTSGPTKSHSSVNTISTIAGTGLLSSSGTGAKATAASFNGLRAVWVSASGVVYVSEYSGNCIRTFGLSDSIVANYAGVPGNSGTSGIGGAATSALLSNPASISLDTSGSLYAADVWAYRIVRVNNGNLYLYAGTGAVSPSADGISATSANFNVPCGVWIDTLGQGFIYSYGSGLIKRISTGGIVFSNAGTGTYSISGDGGPATSANVGQGECLSGVSTGVLYFGDVTNSRIRAISAAGIITSLIGNGDTTYADNVDATSTGLNSPTGVWVDSSNGDLFVSASANNRIIVKSMYYNTVNAYAGVGTTGSSTDSNGDGGPATAAKLNSPKGLFMDTLSVLYASFDGDGKIRTVYSISPTSIPSKSPSFVPIYTPSQAPILPTQIPSASPSRVRSQSNIIFNFAGTGTPGNSGTGSSATSASFYYPRDVWMDTVGALYIAEDGNKCVRKVSASGIVLSVAGICGTGGHSGDGGQATSALVTGCEGVTIDSSGVVYFTEVGNYVRKISVAGILSILMGTGVNSNTGNGFAATAASVGAPYGVYVNSAGTVYVASNSGFQLRQISTSGIVTVFAGTGVCCDTAVSGIATSMGIRLVRVSGDTTSLIYFNDDCVASTLAGSGTCSGDGCPATSADLNEPFGLAIDTSNGDVYVAANVLNKVKVLTRSSLLVYNFAGSGPTSSTGDGGDATAATISGPDGLYLSSGSVLYIADIYGNRIRSVVSGPTAMPTTPPSPAPSSIRSSSNVIFLFAGTGASASGGTDSFATAASFYNPRGIWMDTLSALYVAEENGYCVRKITSSSIVVDFAGACSLVSGWSGDGGHATAAGLGSPVGVAVDSVGNVYISVYEHRARKVSASGIISTIVGTGSAANTGDGGPATSASIQTPYGIFVETNGNIYLSSTDGCQLRRISTSGIISLFGGTGTCGYSGDSIIATSSNVDHPFRMVCDSVGVLYFSDNNNNLIRLVSTLGRITNLIGTGLTIYSGEVAATSAGLNSPMGVVVDAGNGDVYVAVSGFHRVEVMTRSSGLFSVFAGTGTGSSTGDGSYATASTLNAPDGLYLSTGSTLYVSEVTGNKIRLITAAPTAAPTVSPTSSPTKVRSSLNTITTVAGTGVQGNSGTGEQATSTQLNAPRNVWKDSSGYVYISQYLGCCVQRFGADGILLSYAGVCGSCSTGGSGVASSTLIGGPLGIVADTIGSMYFCDFTSNLINKVNDAGIMSIALGDRNQVNSGDNGPATSASVASPNYIGCGSSSQIYFSSYTGYVVRMISASGIVTRFAGIGTSSYSGDGGPATSAALYGPDGLYSDTVGYVYLSGGKRLRKVTSGIIQTLIGTASTTYSGEFVPASAASIVGPSGMAVDANNGDLYVVDNGLLRVFVVTKTTGLMSTYAGSGGAGVVGSDGDGGYATAAQFEFPEGLALDSSSNVFISDWSGQRLRMVSAIVPTLTPTREPTTQPTIPPSSAPSNIPSARPTVVPSCKPSVIPTIVPSLAPSILPSIAPSALPSLVPTLEPSVIPSGAPSVIPSVRPTITPSLLPTISPSVSPSDIPSIQPSLLPTANPTLMPSVYPSAVPSVIPSYSPTMIPSIFPTVQPTAIPSHLPSACPSLTPSNIPSRIPTPDPTISPSDAPSINPTISPTNRPTIVPTLSPSLVPSCSPTTAPTKCPTLSPTVGPTVIPTPSPSLIPSFSPTIGPTIEPTMGPTIGPTLSPSLGPSLIPSIMPTIGPTLSPTVGPTVIPTPSPSLIPSFSPTIGPTIEPTMGPTIGPTLSPSFDPSVSPSLDPTISPTTRPTYGLTITPTFGPTVGPSVESSLNPTAGPTDVLTFTPTAFPTISPSGLPSFRPTFLPSLVPSIIPSVITVDPSCVPSRSPSVAPSAKPSYLPSVVPSQPPSVSPSMGPSLIPTICPSTLPSNDPSSLPSQSPSSLPTKFPSFIPTLDPFVQSSLPSGVPTVLSTLLAPSQAPSCLPTLAPASMPTVTPSLKPSDLSSVLPISVIPTELPSLSPSVEPSTVAPSLCPSLLPSAYPFKCPTEAPSLLPLFALSNMPSDLPSELPTVVIVLPSISPTLCPSKLPSLMPTKSPTVCPSVQSTSPSTVSPSTMPTLVSSAPLLTQRPSCPTIGPSRPPTDIPSIKPTQFPSVRPSLKPSRDPSVRPSPRPTNVPVVKPTTTPSLCPSVKPSLAPTSPTLMPSPGSPSISPSPTAVPSTSAPPTEPPSKCPSVEPYYLPSMIPTTVYPTGSPSTPPSDSPTSCSPTFVPSTVVPTVSPSTRSFYETHPKATLPSNSSISVIGMQPGLSFKVVIPFLSMSSGASEVSPFSDIVLLPGYGNAYVIYGGSSMSSSLSVSTAITFTGAVALDVSKRSVAVIDDANGDSIVDVIIGDPYVSRCYVLFGNAYDPVNMTRGFTIFGEKDSDLLGWSVSGAGDVNNDTLHDIIVGAPGANGVGAFYVIYGRKTDNFDVYLSNLTLSLGFAVYGSQKSDGLGISVSRAGDVNKDGYDDVIVGAVMTSLYYAGTAYILYGGSSVRSLSSTSLISTSQGFRVIGSSYMYAGYCVSSAGDVNNDGYQDILVGSAPQKASVTSAAYLIFGSPSGLMSVSLSSLSRDQGVRISGGGMVVSSLGDANHDDYADVLIGGSYAAVSNSGYIVYTNVSYMTKVTAKPSGIPSFIPVFVPTQLPTRIPTRAPLLPTMLPSRLPSTLTPTTPTCEPTQDVSQPSSLPSTVPSTPTIEPSEAPSEVPTLLPSESPSERPTMYPTDEPSESPSHVPTNAPSESPSITLTRKPTFIAPTLAVVTRAPFALPTLQPTNSSQLPTFFTYVVGSSQSNIDGTRSHSVYIVNTTGSVSITNTLGFIRYIILPNREAHLTISYFNQSTDVIDLSSFPVIADFSYLQLSEGSVYVTLPYRQVVHILNLHVADVTSTNFIFYSQPAVSNAPSKTVKKLSLAAGICIAVFGFLIVSYFSFWFVVSRHKSQQLKQRLMEKGLFLVTLTTNALGEVLLEDAESGVHSMNSSQLLSEHTLNSEGEWQDRRERNSMESPDLSEYSIDSEGGWVDKT